MGNRNKIAEKIDLFLFRTASLGTIGGLHFAFVSSPKHSIETGAELIGSFGAIGFSSYLCVSFSLYFGQVGLLNSHLLLRCWLPMTYARDAKEKIIKQETFFILEFDRSEEN